MQRAAHFFAEVHLATTQELLGAAGIPLRRVRGTLHDAPFVPLVAGAPQPTLDFSSELQHKLREFESAFGALASGGGARLASRSLCLLTIASNGAKDRLGILNIGFKS